jgi:hypothetical protein
VYCRCPLHFTQGVTISKLSTYSKIRQQLLPAKLASWVTFLKKREDDIAWYTYGSIG